MQRTNTWQDAFNTGEAELDLGDGLSARFPLGKRAYTIDQSAGRVVKVWDYLNNREQMIYGDTGERLMTDARITAGYASITRTGNTVQLAANALVLGNETGTLTLLDWAPQGFRPRDIVTSESAAYWSTETTHRMRVNPYNKSVQILGITAGEPINWLVTFRTVDPWPPSLPGTAIGSIPA